jgi:peptidoglycan/LPS O-acetylase OafA/YrhL
MAFLSGSFAVAIFFVLSGFVLSIKFFHLKDQTIIKSMAAKRYIRLMLPALASVLLCYVLIKLGFSHTDIAASVTHSSWLMVQWNFAPHLLDAIRSAMWGIFISSQTPYNNVLWTMTTEFFGSFLVFGFALLFAHSKYRWIVYLLLIIVTINTWYIAFVIGMLFADLHSKGYLQQRKRGLKIVLPLLAVGLFFGGFPIGTPAGPIYSVLVIPNVIGINYLSMYTILGASIVVASVLCVEQIARVLRHKRISVLGKYTFSLYLVHIPILFTFTTGIFVYFNAFIGYNKSVVLSLIVSVPVVWVVAWLFERYIDAPSIYFARYCAQIYEGKQILNLPPVMSMIEGRVRLLWDGLQKRVNISNDADEGMLE